MRSRSESGERIPAADDSIEVRVHVLGSTWVDVPGRAPQPVPGKLGELLGFVALAGTRGRSVPRDDVAFGLWPDTPEDGARRALAAALYRFRRLVPDSEGWFVADRDGFALHAWVDSDAFAAHADSSDPGDWRSALDLYAGDLLPSVDAEWADLPRTILRERSIALLAAVTADLESGGDLPVALTWARRWAVTDPLDEAAHRAVMRLYARSERQAAALEHYGRLASRLQAELGVEPAPATRALAAQILDEARLTGRDRAATRAVPFVGRDRERARLLSLLDGAARGHGGLAVVLGEAGIGKSRLLAELEASAGWRGWQVATGRGEQFGSPAPYAPLGEALRAAITPTRREQLRELVDQVWLDAAASLVPGLGPPAPAWREDGPGQLASAVAEILGGLGSLAPQALLLDDVQWADPAIWPLLDELRPAIAALPILVVVSGRSTELRDQRVAWERLQGWDRDGVPLLPLEGLDPAGLAALSLGLDGRSRSPAEVTALATASGGNPLLALALIAAGEVPIATGTRGTPGEAGGAGGPGGPGDLRAALDRLFEHRLAALPGGVRASLEAAAVVGDRFSYLDWQDVAAEPDLPLHAAELERARLLRLEADGYAFAHDTLRGLIVLGLPADRRRTLHRAALEAAKRRRPDDAVRLLYHAEQLEDAGEVAEWAMRAGELALAGRSYEAAVRHLTRALEVLPAADRAGRYRALLGRIRALDVLAARDAQRLDLHELQDLADALGDPARRIEVAIESATFHWAIAEYGEGEAVASRAIELAIAERDVGGEADLLTILGRNLREEGRLEDARVALTRAQALYARLEDVHGSATALELLGGIAWRLGDHATAAAQHAEAAELFRRTGDVRRAATSLNSVGTALWGLGDYEGAREVHERSLATCRELGDRRGESDNLDNLGGVAWVLADFERAIELYRAALEIRRETRDPRGIAISLMNLGDTYALTGDVEQALAFYDEALEVDRSAGVRRNEATALQGKGRALLDAGRPDEARSLLETATAMHLGLGDRDNLLDTRAALARACVALGDLEAARSAADAADAALSATDRSTLRQWVTYAAWAVDVATGDGHAAAGHLASAAAAMDAFVESVPEGVRPRVLERVPIHRLTTAARRAAAHRVTVRLPPADAALGRPVSKEDLIAVSWTIDDPADAAIAEPAARRRHVVGRLLAEALAQGASATDEDLAAALGVSRRTILRDAQVLAAAGRPLGTRRRSRAGAEVASDR